MRSCGDVRPARRGGARDRFILDRASVRGYPYATFSPSIAKPEGGAREQADVPAIQHSSEAHPRLPEADEDASGPAGPQASPREGPQAPQRDHRQEVGTLGPASFPKRDRLRKRADYVDVQQRGRKVHSDHFLLLWLRDVDRGTVRTRIGITVSSRVGNAVVRNRLKRWIREFARHHKDGFPAGDVAIVAKTSASDQAHDVVDRDLQRLLARARAATSTR